MKPVRLRLSRARGFNLQEHSRATNGLEAVNVSRPGPHGNPFIVGKHGNRSTCVRFFVCLFDGLLPILDRETMAASRALIPKMRQMAREIAGKNVGCWCALPAPGEPDMCHGFVWLAVANAPNPVLALRPLTDAWALIDERADLTPRVRQSLTCEEVKP